MLDFVGNAGLLKLKDHGEIQEVGDTVSIVLRVRSPLLPHIGHLTLAIALAEVLPDSKNEQQSAAGQVMGNFWSQAYISFSA